MIDKRRIRRSLCVQGFGIDLLKHVSRMGYQGSGRFRPIAGWLNVAIAPSSWLSSWTLHWPFPPAQRPRRLHEPVKIASVRAASTLNSSKAHPIEALPEPKYAMVPRMDLGSLPSQYFFTGGIRT